MGVIPASQLVRMQQRGRPVRVRRRVHAERVAPEAYTPTPAEQVQRCGFAPLEAVAGLP